MAYNREWDQGKDTWAESSWGGSYNDRGNVRGREQDYYNDGKRRKYNNGGFQSQNVASGGEEAGPGRLGHPGAHDYGHDDRRGPGFSGKKRLVPSEPSPHVIFLGLDPDFTESDVGYAYHLIWALVNLLSISCKPISQATGAQSKPSQSYETKQQALANLYSFCTCIDVLWNWILQGVSKGFGFAQFATTEHARAFVDPIFPFIQVPPPASHGASASAAFYKALETNTPHNGRRAKIDYSQSATPHDKGRANRGNTNDGTRDIGNSQGPVLLFRGLDPLSGPQAIHQAMLYSSGPGTKGAKGMRRIILIKDKVTMASFGFAFVEFVDTASASAVLAATMDATLHPSGFRISDRPVAASFAHPYSFQPVTDFLSRDEACLQSTSSLGGSPGNWIRYWDDSSTVAVLEFKVEEPVANISTTKEKKEKKKKPDAEAAALRPLPLAPSTLPVSDKPLTLSFGKLTTKSAAAKPVTLGFSMDDSGGGEDDENLEDTLTEVKKITGQKVAPLIASKKTANNITKWNQVQEELTGHSSTPEATPASVVQASVPVETSKTPENDFEFSDVAALMCLLCARQFKSADQLKRHNRESELHKKNMKDSALQEVARTKLASRKAQVTDQPKYRDRASERRTLFNQPDAPVVEADSSYKAKKYDVPPAPSPPPPVVNPGEDASNVGNKLLKMMGWTEGSGLGTNGEGRVDPIPTAIYASGVGLGASKGKDITKYTEGYSGYVQMAQDAARQRYES